MSSAAAVAISAESAATAAALAGASFPNALPAGPADAGEHSSCGIDAATFSVRSKGYLTSSAKEPSAGSLFDLMHVEFFRSASKMGNVAARPDSWLRAARAAGDTRYYYVVNYVTTSTPYIHLAIYFAVQPERVRANPRFQSLWARFTAAGAAGDAFRNERWKVVPRIKEGPWAVQYAVGTKPALLGAKLAHTWVLCHPEGAAGAAGTAAGAGEGGGSGGSGSSSSGAGGGAGAGADLPAGTAAPAPGAAGSGGSGGDSGASSRARSTSFAASHGPGPYLESDCDVASSSVALVLVALIQSSAKCVCSRRRRRRAQAPAHSAARARAQEKRGAPLTLAPPPPTPTTRPPSPSPLRRAAGT